MYYIVGSFMLNKRDHYSRVKLWINRDIRFRYLPASKGATYSPTEISLTAIHFTEKAVSDEV